jgi:hypothetical protein
MGDRAYSSVTVRISDMESWLAKGYDTESDDDVKVSQAVRRLNPDAEITTLIDEERNYAISDDPCHLVAGTPMVGWHEAGGDYPANLVAWDGETFAQIECLDGGPVVAYDEWTGEPKPASLAAFHRYREVRDRAMTMLAANLTEGESNPQETAMNETNTARIVHPKPCPTCGEKHPPCSICGAAVRCPPDEAGEPFAWCDACDAEMTG